jgi:hypothetical protein
MLLGSGIKAQVGEQLIDVMGVITVTHWVKHT